MKPNQFPALINGKIHIIEGEATEFKIEMKPLRVKHLTLKMMMRSMRDAKRLLEPKSGKHTGSLP